MDEQTARAMGEPIGGLPLRKITYRGEVHGTDAAFVVEQEFGNDLTAPVEAVYVFPLPDEAAVLGVEMQIGDRTIIANLRKRNEARQAYEDARDAGHHAALVEQERPNVFTMNVAGVAPGETVRVRVRYSAPVGWQEQGGRLRIPTVVAPRFIPGEPTGKSGAGWAPDTDAVPDASKITPQVVADVPYVVHLDLALTPGFPADVASPTHPEAIPVASLAAGATRVINAGPLRPDRDIVVTYATTAVAPSVAVTRSVGEHREEFLLVQLTPAARAVPTNPLDVVFLLDVSGSMRGAKLEGLKRVAERVLDALAASKRPTRVGIVEFESEHRVRVALSPIGKAHVKAIRALHDRGGTVLGPALTAAFGMFGNEGDGCERCIVLATDGETESLEHAPRPGVRVHGIGIDSAVNDTTLLDIARQTGGTTEWMTPGEDYAAAASRIAALASGPVIADVAVRGLPAIAVATRVRDCFIGKPTTFAVRFSGTPKAFTVSGRGADGVPYEWPIAVPEASGTDLARIRWARERLREETDRDAQTELSLAHGIVCGTTAFVAVSEKRDPTGKPVRVDIPVALPHAWEFDVPAARAFIGALYTGAAAAIDDVSAMDAPTRSLGSFRGSARRTPATLRTLTRGVATTLPPAPPTVAEVFLDDLAAFVRDVRQGSSERTTSDRQWADLVRRLTAEEAQRFSGWTPEQKAQCYALLVEVRPFGYTMVVPAELAEEPSDSAARSFWARARRTLGFGA